MGLRITAAIPLFASIVSIALSIVILVSGTNTSNADGNYWLAINTSGVGSGLVQVTAAPDSDTGALGGLINSIPGLDSILDNITNSVGSGLNDLQGDLLGGVASALGLQQYYALYTTNMCQGNFTSTSDEADVAIQECYSYSSQGQGLLNLTNSIPSSVVVGTAEVSVPLVETLKKTLDLVVNLATGAATALMVFLIVGAVSSGLVAIASLFSALRSQSRLLTNINLGFSILAFTSFFLIALIMSLVVGISSYLFNSFGAGISLHVKGGGLFIGLLWVTAVLSGAAAGYWILIWFVEFRRSAFSRRSRTPDQIGGYVQLFGELRKDFRVNGHQNGPTQYGKAEGGLMTDY